MKSKLSSCVMTAIVIGSVLTIPGRADAQRAAVARSATADEAPRDATGRCRDGSFTTESDVVAACAARTGVLVTFPVRKAPPPPVSTVERRSAAQATAVTPARPESPAPPPVPATRREENVAAAPLAVTPIPSPGSANTMTTVAEPVAASRPRGARGQCKDGSYFVGAAESSCGSNGGIAVTFPASTTPPPAVERRPASPRGG